MAYRTLNPFTEQTLEVFEEHTDAQVEAALAKADADSTRLMGEGEAFVRLTEASTNYIALGEAGFAALTRLVREIRLQIEPDDCCATRQK